MLHTGVAARQAAFFRPAGGRSRAPAARHLAARCEAAPPAASAASTEALFGELTEILEDYRRAPPSVKNEISGEVLTTVQKLQQAGALKKWGAAQDDVAERRNTMLGELRRVGIKAPDAIAKVSVRNDAAFLFSVVASTSVAAVVLGQLPGDWGFFSSYLCGGITIVVLAVGSTNPGLLQFAIDTFSKVFPDYKERVVGHEAAHFLVGYLMGVPVASYSLLLGKEHTDFAEGKLQKRLIERSLEGREVDTLSIIAMAGATSEALKFEEVIGQTADMMDLQRIMSRSQTRMSDSAQQNQTRWAVYQAASLLQRYPAEYEALQAAMARGASVPDCIRAIEGC